MGATCGCGQEVVETVTVYEAAVEAQEHALWQWENGSTFQVQKITYRPGGQYETVFHGPNGPTKIYYPAQ